MIWTAFAMGLIIGSVIANCARFIFSARGTLKVDHSNPKKDLYRFDIDSIDAINKKTHMYLKIDHHADLSQD